MYKKSQTSLPFRELTHPTKPEKWHHLQKSWVVREYLSWLHISSSSNFPFHMFLVFGAAQIASILRSVFLVQERMERERQEKEKELWSSYHSPRCCHEKEKLPKPLTWFTCLHMFAWVGWGFLVTFFLWIMMFQKSHIEVKVGDSNWQGKNHR